MSYSLHFDAIIADCLCGNRFSFELAVIVVLTGMLSLKRLSKECVTKGVKLFFRISDGKRTLRISCLKFKFKI